MVEVVSRVCLVGFSPYGGLAPTPASGRTRTAVTGQSLRLPPVAGPVFACSKMWHKQQAEQAQPVWLAGCYSTLRTFAGTRRSLCLLHSRGTARKASAAIKSITVRQACWPTPLPCKLGLAGCSGHHGAPWTISCFDYFWDAFAIIFGGWRFRDPWLGVLLFHTPLAPE